MKLRKRSKIIKGYIKDTVLTGGAWRCSTGPYLEQRIKGRIKGVEGGRACVHCPKFIFILECSRSHMQTFHAKNYLNFVKMENKGDSLVSNICNTLTKVIF